MSYKSEKMAKNIKIVRQISVKTGLECLTKWVEWLTKVKKVQNCKTNECKNWA